MIQKESYGFNTFTGVRVGEIQEKTRKEEWFWVEGSLNVADMISRGIAAKELSGIWQPGPHFLREPEDSWPIKQSCSESELPEQVAMVVSKSPPDETNNGEILDLSRFSKYDKAVRVIARILNIRNGTPSFRNIAKPPIKIAYRKQNVT